MRATLTVREVWRIRKQIQRRFPTKGQSCEICGDTEKIHRHHRDQDILNNVAENIAFLCKECHVEVHSIRRSQLVAQWVAQTI